MTSGRDSPPGHRRGQARVSSHKGLVFEGGALTLNLKAPRHLPVSAIQVWGHLAILSAPPDACLCLRGS